MSVARVLDRAARRASGARAACVLGSLLALACGDGARGPEPADPAAAAPPPAAGAAETDEPAFDEAQWERIHAARNPRVFERLRALEARLKETPDDPAAHAELGWAYQTLDRWKDARRHLERAIELAPNVPPPYFFLGRMDLQENDARAAIRRLERAVALAPAYPGAQRELGRAYLSVGATDQALAALRTASAHDPKDAESRFLHALLLQDTDPEAAVVLLEEAIAAQPLHTGALQALARLYGRAGRRDDAERLAERHREAALLSDLGVEKRPHEPDRYLLEARYYAKHGRTDKALEVCAAGLARHARHPEIAFLRGLICTDAGRLDEARDALDDAAEWMPEEQRYAAALAELYTRVPSASATPRTRAHLRAAAERWPDAPVFAEALANLGGD